MPVTDRSDPSVAMTLPFQLTPTIHREISPAVSPTNPENLAKGKIIVITGGGTGIGAASASIWIQAGAEGVIITGRRKGILDETITSLSSLSQETGTKLLAVQTDLTKSEDTDRLFIKIKATFGRVPDVILAGAGPAPQGIPIAEQKPQDWWAVIEGSLLTLHNTVTSYINSQPDPKNPTGTIININSGASGLLLPGSANYSIGKLAAQRYIEYLNVEYPTLRAFALLPGIVNTGMTDEAFALYAQDEAGLSGAWALYLSRSAADFLKGGLVSVNWDVDEVEAHKDEIVEKGLLRLGWVGVLPAAGGRGFE